MKKILVPVDFSPASLNAMKVAGQLATRSGADLHLLHVNEMMPYVAPLSEYAYTSSAVNMDMYNQELENRIQLVQKDLAAQPGMEGVSIETTVVEGLMLPAIQEMIEDHQIDLVVMGTLGASGLKEVFLGSNTERIIRHAECPVLVIPVGIDHLDLRRVVIPSTLKADQQAVFLVAKAWQDLFGFDVQVLYLNDPLGAPTHGTIETEKNKLTEQAGLRHVYVHIHGISLNQEATIRRYADEADGDMIIMGTHQRRGLSHLWFGSIAEDTANHAHLPVLTVPL
jgi:nucleotide-binding universal stress UspA family protein